MAVIFCSYLQSPFAFSSQGSIGSPKLNRLQISACSSLHMESNSKERGKFMEFPYVSAPHRKLMVDLFSAMETRLHSLLLPCTLPPDVQYYQNNTSTANASLHIRSGNEASPIDFILGSWLHCKLPTGGALNITSISSYLNTSTDAPNFLIELIQSSPTALVLILDLPPRKDLVLHPNYLETFYEDTKLESQRQLLDKIAEVRPYYTSSLYIRSVVSPTAIMVRIEAEAGRPERVEEIIKDHVDPIAKQVLGIWLDKCSCVKKDIGEVDRAYLEKRDRLVKNKTIEIDLGSNLPRLFGPEIADRVLGVMRDYFDA